MAVDSDLIATYFDNEEYGKIITEVDKKGGFESCTNSELESYYLLSCQHLKKPRKLSTNLKKIINIKSKNKIVIKLLETALGQKTESTISSIEKHVTKNSDLDVQVKAIILNSVMKEEYKDKNTTTLLVSERIINTLNNNKFYKLDRCGEILESIRIRVQKIFRAKNYARIITWLENLEIREENFPIYRFFILSQRGIGESEQVKQICLKSITKLKEPDNIEGIMDILYTAGENKIIGESLSNYELSRMTFRTNLIYARSLKKLGDVKKSELILEGAKETLRLQIEEEKIDIEVAIRNIKEIGFSGDIKLSEYLLYNLISSNKFSSKLVESRRIHEMVNLFKDTLDRQKRIKLVDDLEIAKMLIKDKKTKRAINLLEPYIMHGIRNSADLFELYTVALKSENELDKIDELVYSFSNDLKLATSERMANFLEQNGLYRQHSILFELMPNSFLDSFKLIRSYFNVLEKYSGSLNPENMLIRISTIKKPKPGTIIYFVDRYTRMSSASNIETILKTIRVNKVTKIICNVRILNVNNERSEMNDIMEDIMSLSLEEKKKSIFTKMIEEFVVVAYRNYEFEKIIKVIRKFKLDKEFNNQIISTYINSLIGVEEYEEIVLLLEQFKNEFSDIQRWRFLIEIGKSGEVSSDLETYTNAKLSTSDQRNLKALLFKLGKFREYIERTSKDIHHGEFSLSTLTRHFYSLYKLGDDQKCHKEYKKLYKRFCHNSEKRAIIAIVGYDFGLSNNYLDELDLAILMDPRGHKISLLIANAFLNLERVDIAFKYYKDALIKSQNDFRVLEVGRRIERLLIDLSIEPQSISNYQIINMPIYTDVAVIRALIDEIKTKPKTVKRKKYTIGVQSHTLDIGGAERQVSYLLNLLEKGKVKSKGYSLITHKTPNLSEYEETYYTKIKYDKTDIIEYIKPPKFDYEVVIDNRIEDIIGHLSSLKERRLRNLIQIYQHKNFDIVHTWQDYCNIYGGIAALIAGSKVIMSARTLPPPQKGKLASRSGRSYRECYQLLLAQENVILTHNSDFGREEYVEWLDAPEEKNLTIHNGVDTTFTENSSKGSRIDIINTLELEKDSLIVGYVGRFTTDKRPWLFLKTAESIIMNNGVKGKQSDELREWFDGIEGSSVYDTEVIENNDVKKPIHFVMLGDGPQFDRAKGIIERSDILKNRMHLIGFSNKVNSYLNEFDCFLLTSKVEGLPNVIIEAQSRGVSVVSTDVGGAKECLLEGETGFISQNGYPDSLAKLVLDILSDEEFRNRTSEKSPKFVIDKFGEKTWSRNMNKLYSGGLG